MKQPAYQFDRLRYVWICWTLEWAVILASGVGFHSFAGNPFFSLGVDPLQWAPFLLHLPQWISGHAGMGWLLDIGLLTGGIALIRNPHADRLALIQLMGALLFYTMLTGYLGHRNFHTGMFLVFVPFVFQSVQSRSLAYEAVRYFLLFFYCSAGWFKLVNGHLWDTSQMQSILQQQLLPYYLESSSNVRVAINQYLLHHATLAQGLYVLSFLAEFGAILGFFTRKFDRWILVALLAFHLPNWIVMDIAPIGQLSFLLLLWISALPKSSVKPDPDAG